MAAGYLRHASHLTKDQREQRPRHLDGADFPLVLCDNLNYRVARYARSQFESHIARGSTRSGRCPIRQENPGTRTGAERVAWTNSGYGVVARWTSRRPPAADSV